MSTDARTVLGKARDQGRRPTCVAFAATAAHELRRHTVHEDTTSLSEEFICWAVADEFGRIAPLDFHDTSAVMSRHGQPTSAQWPYQLDRTPATAPPDHVIESAAKRRARVRAIDADRASVRNTVDGGAVVVAIIRLWDEFFEGRHAMLEAPEPDELHADDVLHAVALLPGDDGYTLRNSWGTDWCNDGHVHVTADLIDVVTVGAFVVDFAEPT